MIHDIVPPEHHRERRAMRCLTAWAEPRRRQGINSRPPSSTRTAGSASWQYLSTSRSTLGKRADRTDELWEAANHYVEDGKYITRRAAELGRNHPEWRGDEVFMCAVGGRLPATPG